MSEDNIYSIASISLIDQEVKAYYNGVIKYNNSINKQWTFEKAERECLGSFFNAGNSFNFEIGLKQGTGTVDSVKLSGNQIKNITDAISFVTVNQVGSCYRDAIVARTSFRIGELKKLTISGDMQQIDYDFQKKTYTVIPKDNEYAKETHKM